LFLVIFAMADRNSPRTHWFALPSHRTRRTQASQSQFDRFPMLNKCVLQPVVVVRSRLQGDWDMHVARSARRPLSDAERRSVRQEGRQRAGTAPGFRHPELDATGPSRRSLYLRRILRVMGFPPSNFQLGTPSRSRLMVQHGTDKQTADRQRSSLH